jgi:hypothetical protein
MKSLTQFIRLLIRVVFKICLLGSMLIVVTPIAYFSWRASQPMELPQFDGKTYFDWLKSRHAAYDDLAQEYRSSHPKQEVKDGLCFFTEVGVQLMAALPNSGFYALAGIYPSLQTYTNPKDRREGFVPSDVNWAGFLPAWWKTYEKFVWAMAEHAPHGPVAYCRIRV